MNFTKAKLHRSRCFMSTEYVHPLILREKTMIFLGLYLLKYGFANLCFILFLLSCFPFATMVPKQSRHMDNSFDIRPIAQKVRASCTSSLSEMSVIKGLLFNALNLIPHWKSYILYWRSVSLGVS